MRRQSADDGAEDGSGQQEAKLTISEKLVKRLSAHRTAALQAKGARRPRVALVAVVASTHAALHS